MIGLINSSFRLFFIRLDVTLESTTVLTLHVARFRFMFKTSRLDNSQRFRKRRAYSSPGIFDLKRRTTLSCLLRYAATIIVVVEVMVIDLVVEVMVIDMVVKVMDVMVEVMELHQ